MNACTFRLQESGTHSTVTRGKIIAKHLHELFDGIANFFQRYPEPGYMSSVGDIHWDRREGKYECETTRLTSCD